MLSKKHVMYLLQKSEIIDYDCPIASNLAYNCYLKFSELITYQMY